MRVDQLISELSECEPGAEVVIVTSLDTAVALMGVIDEGDAVLLDPSASETPLELLGGKSK